MPSTLPAVQTRFVPADIDCTSADVVASFYRTLLARPVSTLAELEAWLIDRGELEAAISQAGANLYIAMTCDTETPATQQAYATFVETIPPAIKPLSFELDRRQVALSGSLGLPAAKGQRYHVLARDVEAEVALFREANIPLQTELSLLSQKYDQLMGSLTVRFQGEERTMPQMARFQEYTDRPLRESAWRAVVDRRLKETPSIDGIFDQMIALRDKVAKNAGYTDFTTYVFHEKHRFDYTESHCRAYHDACEHAIVPMLRRLQERRRVSLAIPVGELRPWDLSVDVKCRQPLRPFEGGRELTGNSVALFHDLDPRLGSMLASLGDGTNSRGISTGECLDLDTRKGKAPGGYQYMRDRERRPFIFMNASGMSSDVTTMLHEAGHAFHSFFAASEPILAYRSAPMEFCEVASMSMELLAMPHLQHFYKDPADLARARRQQLERSINILPWIAQIDAFQFWLYKNPSHTHTERTQAWLALDARFGAAVNWQGIEPARATLWQRQSHLFGAPFYYIEYAIAQLGALQLWLVSLEQGERAAVDAYARAMSLGGSRPLPDLFAAAGLTFDFGPATVKRLTDRVESELAKLPE